MIYSLSALNPKPYKSMPHTFTTAVVIPARYESSRFPGKPLVLINGVSLLERTFRRVQLVGSKVTSIVIATDDKRIQEHAQSFGAHVVMTSSDCLTGTDRVAEAVKLLPELQSMDCIINVQGDEPCIDPQTIGGVIDLLHSNPDLDIGTAVCQIHSDKDLASSNVVKCVLSKANRVLYFSRLPIPGNKQGHSTVEGKAAYFRHIGIYGFRTKSLLRFSSMEPTPLQQEEDIEALRALEHGMNISAIHITTQAPGVDTPSDIEEVIAWLAKIR